MTGHNERLSLLTEPLQTDSPGSHVEIACQWRGGPVAHVATGAQGYDFKVRMNIRWDELEPMGLYASSGRAGLSLPPQEGLALLNGLLEHDRLMTRAPTTTGVETSVFSSRGFRVAWPVFAGECATIVR